MPPISRVILYVKDVAKVAVFYERNFGLRPLPGAAPEWIELAGQEGGCAIALHKAAAGQKSGAAIKVVFGVADIQSFIREKESDGLKVWPCAQSGWHRICQRQGSGRKLHSNFQSRTQTGDSACLILRTWGLNTKE